MQKNIDVYSHIHKILNSSYQDLSIEIKEEGDGIIKNALANSETQQQPSYLHIAGIPGAGKSTFIKNNINSGIFGEKFILIAFDSIMMNLKGYKHDYATTKNMTTELLAELFAKYEMPARIIGYELLQQAINNKMNIVFENSGSFLGNLALMDNLKKAGYNTIFHSIECNQETALKRVGERAKSEQRYTSARMIKERFELYEDLKSQYKAMANKSFTHLTD